MIPADFYQVLDVRPDATPEEIRAAYYRLARACHPDVSTLPDAEERMRRINEAYEVLGDPGQRAAYDRDRRVPEPAPVRKAWEAPPAAPVRSDDPRYGRTRQEPVQPRSRNRTVPFAAAFWISLLLAGLLAAVFIGAGIPEVPLEEPFLSPVPATTVVIVVTPAALVQKTFEEWKQDGDRFRTQGRSGDALAAYDQALAIRPNASELWIAEGDLYSRMGSLQKARSSYTRAARINASANAEIRDRIRVLDNYDIWMERADLLVEAGEYSEAVGMYDAILAPGILSDSLHKRVLSAKLYALMREGRTGEANAVTAEIRALA